LLWIAMSGAAIGFLILGIWGELTEGLGTRLLVAYCAMFIPLCVYSLLWLLRAYFYRVELRDWGLEEFLPGRQRIAMRWEEVAFISYSKPRDSLVFHRINNTPLRLLMELDGLGQLRLALERVYGQLDPTVAERLSRNEAAPFVA